MLILFILAILGFFIMYFVVLYHIVKNASLTKASALVSIILALCAIICIFFTFYLLRDVSWKSKITLPDDVWSSNNSFFEGDNTL